MTSPTHPAVTCDSCGMPIETGRYCRHCTDAEGNLQGFEERFARMVDFRARQDPQAARADLERAALEHLAQMPAWRDHPRVTAARG